MVLWKDLTDGGSSKNSIEGVPSKPEQEDEDTPDE